MVTDYQAIIQDLVDSYGGWFLDEERLQDGMMTNHLYPYNHLFSPIQVNSVKIKNRIVMGPMGNICMCDETGRPNNKMIQYFTERARGGTGLITSGLVPVDFNVEAALTEPGDLTILPRIDRSRTVYPGWRILAENIHAYGARFFIQLTPGLGRVSSPECLIKKFRLPVSASWNPNFYIPQIPCRPLRDGECLKIIKNAGQAAADARALLIDGVYLHGHEGYLLEQMTNRAFNRRKLGRFADWQAFGIELVKHIRQRCGDDYPIMYRIDLSLALNETYGKRMAEVSSLKKFSRERTVEMTLDYMVNLVRAGVDIFDVDLGCYDNWWLPHPPTPMPPGCYLPVAKIVKDYFNNRNIRSNAGLSVPVVGVGKLGYPDLAERALHEGYCDMIMLARPLLADPEWPDKAYAGRITEIRPCIGDQEACLNEFIQGGHPQCAVNPRTGFEDVLCRAPVPAGKPKKIAVVGAGPAGILCACTAARRGHYVSLFEKLDEVGGELVPGSVPEFKYDVANYLRYLKNTLSEASRSCELAVHLEVTATIDLLKGGGFDAIVTCTGGRPVSPAVEGIEQPYVVQAVDLLRDTALADGAQKVVVIGGGSVGCEVAFMLSCELGKQVTVVEMLPYLMKEVCTASRGHLIHYLEKAGVQILNCTRLKSVGKNSVTLVRNISTTVPDPYNTWSPILPENIPNPLAKKIKVKDKELEEGADLIVLAVGLKPDDSLYEACLREHVAPEIRNIGDSFSVGRVFEATKAGYATGISI
ncbi:MAG: FAD-dependent oxidoreductase [Dehalococcoidia bacterium]|nr:FAD-dependent oxidoreductase [Dehalococcoidia bacterium]MDD5494262.1 FAD-dependent oxidoreductase [Dehalococcoidia bacterium]